MITNLIERRADLAQLPRLLRLEGEEMRRERELAASAKKYRDEYATERARLEAFIRNAPFNADIEEVSSARVRLETIVLMQARIPDEKAIVSTNDTGHYGAKQTRARLAQYADYLEAQRKRLLGEIPFHQAKVDAPAVIKNEYRQIPSLGAADNSVYSSAAYEQARERHYGPLRQKVAELQAELGEVESFLCDYRKVVEAARGL